MIVSKYLLIVYYVLWKVGGVGLDFKKLWFLFFSCLLFNDEITICFCIKIECFLENWRENLFFVSIVN